MCGNGTQTDMYDVRLEIKTFKKGYQMKDVWMEQTFVRHA